MSLPQLESVLSFECQEVIQHYLGDHPAVAPQIAHQLFKDLLGWLWLSAYRQQRNLQSHMITPLIRLDEMWHVFILHTRLYTEFCQQYFHRYLHHEVEPAGSEVTFSSAELSAYLEECYEYLGESWIQRNFASMLSD